MRRCPSILSILYADEGNLSDDMGVGRGGSMVRRELRRQNLSMENFIHSLLQTTLVPTVSRPAATLSA